MNRKYLYSLLLLLALSISGLFWGSLYWNQPPEKITANTEVEIQINASDLLSNFIEDESKANNDFVERIIEVSGVVKEVTFLNNRYTVLLQGKGEYACLICDMDDTEVNGISKVAIGDTITLKGVCKGFLMDAILLNCVLVNP